MIKYFFFMERLCCLFVTLLYKGLISPKFSLFFLFFFFPSNSAEATYFQASYISSLYLIHLVSLLDFSIVNHNTGSPTLQLSSLSISLNFLKFSLSSSPLSSFFSHSSASSFSSCILIHLSLSPLVLGYPPLVFPLLGQFGKKMV